MIIVHHLDHCLNRISKFYKVMGERCRTKRVSQDIYRQEIFCITDLIKKEMVKVVYVPTHEIVPDAFTKPLSHAIHAKHVRRSGFISG